MPSNLTGEADTLAWARSNWPAFDADQIKAALDLYPSTDFVPGLNASAQFFRASRMEPDFELACPSVLRAQAMANHSSDDTSAYMFVLNETVFAQLFADEGAPFLGVSHFSDIPFVFNEVSAPEFNGTASLRQLADQINGSWAAFAARGDPVAKGVNGFLAGWDKAYGNGTAKSGPYNPRVLGGPRDGDVVLGTKAEQGKALYDEDLLAKCAFWNSEEILRLNAV